MNATTCDLVELVDAVTEEASRWRSSPLAPEALLETLPEVGADVAEQERDWPEDQSSRSAERQLESFGHEYGEEQDDGGEGEVDGKDPCSKSVCIELDFHAVNLQPYLQAPTESPEKSGEAGGDDRGRLIEAWWHPLGEYATTYG